MLLVIEQRAAERALGAAAAENAKLLGREPLPPLVVAQFQLGRFSRTNELAGLVDNESKLLASAAQVEMVTDANDVSVSPDIKAIFQGGIFLVILLGACYAAAEIVLAFALMLVLQPAMQFLERGHSHHGEMAVFSFFFVVLL